MDPFGNTFHKKEAPQWDAVQRQQFFERAAQKRRTMEEAIAQRNIPVLRRLVFEEDGAVEFLIALQYRHLILVPFEKLNPTQQLFCLCMRLEDACQADSILSLTDEKADFLRLPRMYEAYLEMGAPKTARALRRMIGLMPEGTFEEGIVPEWKWFFADPKREKQIKEIDSEIAGYPDGVMHELYKSYLQRENVLEKLMEL